MSFRILEVGSGRSPWPLKACIYTTYGASVEVHESLYEAVTDYVGIEPDMEAIPVAEKSIRSFENGSHGCTLRDIGRVQFRNTTIQDFSDPESFDAVVLDNIINVPEMEYPSEDDGPYPEHVILTHAQKLDMIRHAAHFVRDEGILLLELAKSPDYAKALIDTLRDSGALPEFKLGLEFGSLEDRFGRAEYCIFGLVFRRTNREVAPRCLPLSDAQRVFISRWYGPREWSFY